MRLKSIQTTDRSERSEAVFYNVSYRVAFVVFIVGCAYLFGGENASELKETLDGIIKIRRCIHTRAHQANESARVNLRAWKYAQLDETPLARQISTHLSRAHSS